MVLTRMQTRELQEREQSTLTSQCNPLDSINDDPADENVVVDTVTGGTPPRCVLQTHNTLASNTMTPKGMQGSARKGLTSWPLGGSRGGALENEQKQNEKNNNVVSPRGAVADEACGAAEPVAPPTQRAVVAPAHHQDGGLPTQRAVVLPTGPEPTDHASQIDLYPSRASFVPYAVEDLPSTTSSIVENIGATNWVAQVNAMNELRRLVAHHGTVCDVLLEKNAATVFPAIIKAIKSPRSNVSKSAIMTVRDLFELLPGAMGTELEKDAGLANTNGLLMVLLTKAASNEKKFVVDEAVGALDSMCGCVEPSIVLRPALSGATEHKNPKVRGRCFVLLRSVVTNARDLDGLLLSGEGVLSSVVVACDRGTTDNTPEARECAREVMWAVFKDGRSDKLRALMEEVLMEEVLMEEVLMEEVLNEGGGSSSSMGSASVLLRYSTKVLGNNRGKAVLLLNKCNLC